MSSLTSSPVFPLPRELGAVPGSRRLVYAALCHLGESSADEIVRATYLSKSAVRESLVDLEDEELVESRPKLKNGGRRWRAQVDA